MKEINRRSFLYQSSLTAVAASLPFSTRGSAAPYTQVSQSISGFAPSIIDTNIHLFEWPFRQLKYNRTKALVEKLRKHRISQAWAGSYEALLHKDIDGVNARLANECRTRGEGMLLPFGTVNLAWPDWEEDLRRCDEVYSMPGIRIYPAYQGLGLEHPGIQQLIHQATERGLLIQIVGDMEDARVHHPKIDVLELDMAPLIDVLRKQPEAKVQLLYWNHQLRHTQLERLIAETNAVLDTSRIESAGGVKRLIEGDPWSGSNAPLPVDRVLFGSHAPYFPVETNVLKLFESPFDRDQMRAVMCDNARSLLG